MCLKALGYDTMKKGVLKIRTVLVGNGKTLL